MSATSVRTGSAEANKAAVRRFVEEYQTGGDDRALEELIAPDVIDHSASEGQPAGREGVRAIFDTFRAALPDFRAEIFDQVAEGDRVVTRKAFFGTHRGELMGIPPTGRQLRIDLIDIVRLEGGRIVEHWAVIDQLGLMRQLGALQG